MPTRFTLPVNVQRVGNECPPYLTEGVFLQKTEEGSL